MKGPLQIKTNKIVGNKNWSFLLRNQLCYLALRKFRFTSTLYYFSFCIMTYKIISPSIFFSFSENAQSGKMVKTLVRFVFFLNIWIIRENKMAQDIHVIVIHAHIYNIQFVFSVQITTPFHLKKVLPFVTFSYTQHILQF